jgi:cell division protein FtsZ
MATIRQYTAAEATVICGAVFDDGMEDSLRVTVVATGLGGAVAKRKPEMKVIESYSHGLRTGTDNLPIVDATAPQQFDLTNVMGGRGASRGAGLNTPSTQATDMAQNGMDKYDIPAFLRRQSD